MSSGKANEASCPSTIQKIQLWDDTIVHWIENGLFLYMVSSYQYTLRWSRQVLQSAIEHLYCARVAGKLPP